MAEAKPTLDALRAEIDGIDDELHRLLMRRAQLALSIGAVKNSHGPEAGFMRPSREAQLLRRLAAKEDGPLPKAVIIRLWREVIGAVLRLQGPFSVAVHAPDGAAGYWDLARDHFGSLTPATAHDSPQQVLHAVTAGRAVVGILPLPDGGDPQPWWPMMLAKDPKHPRVVARLPFGAGETVRGAPIEALVVAQSPLEETGRDRSLLVIEATEEMSRSALLADSREAKLAASVIQSWQPPSEAMVWLHLVDVEGFVPLGDKRLASFSRRIGKGLQQIWHIGGYAVPLSAAELGSSRKG
jgi:chorismate mutase / prephenate dehydratase